MLKKIKKTLYNFLYSLPFGLKGADIEIFGQKDSSNGSNITIQQQINEKKLSDALLQGEVTQEVEELRYRTYKVAKESENYNYLGEGIAIKEKKVNQPQEFYVKNHIICESVGHELNRVGDYSVDRYLLKVKYSDIPRFKLEKYCQNIKVNLKNKKISLYFEKNTDEPEIRMFLNEMESITKGKKSELISYPIEFSFTTNDTFLNYKFQGVTYETIISNQFEYILEYNFKEYFEEDITKKFYSKTMDEKYQNKECKNVNLSLIETQRKRYCSSCGKEIDLYDGDITEKTYGYPLCNDCIKKLDEFKIKIW